MKNPRNIFLNCVLPLLISLVIYILFRPQDTIVNKFLFGYLTDVHLSLGSSRFNWIIYNLPGALWLYSFMYYNTIYNKRLRNCTFPLIFALGIEIFQLLKITDGTFDLLDVGFYLFTWLISATACKFFRTQDLSMLPSARRKTWHKVAFTLFLAIVYLSDVWH